MCLCNGILRGRVTEGWRLYGFGGCLQGLEQQPLITVLHGKSKTKAWVQQNLLPTGKKRREDGPSWPRISCLLLCGHLWQEGGEAQESINWHMLPPRIQSIPVLVSAFYTQPLLWQCIEHVEWSLNRSGEGCTVLGLHVWTQYSSCLERVVSALKLRNCMTPAQKVAQCPWPFSFSEDSKYFYLMNLFPYFFK